MQQYRNDLIRGLMAQKRISVDKLAEMTALSVNTISSIRQGNDAKVSTLEAIARALEIPVRDLFSGDGQEAA